MMKSMMMFAALALVAVGLNYAGELPRSAEAAPKYQANLTWDGGATGVTQVALIGKNQTVQLVPVKSVTLPNGSQFCFKTCTSSTCVPDCSKDMNLNVPTVTYQASDAGAGSTASYTWVNAPVPPALIDMGSDSYIVVGSLDAGNPNVNLYLIISTPKAF